MRKEREECLRNGDWISTPERDEAKHTESASDEASYDPSLASLDAIVAFSQENAKSKTKDGQILRPMTVKMKSVKAVPKYDTWVPVKRNYWAGKQLHVEPYMPFLGDGENDCELAFEVYEDMAGDAGKDLDLSDGELGSNGEFVRPKDDVDRHQYYSLNSIRWREGIRKAIHEVLKRQSRTDEKFWKVLAAAVGVKDIKRLKALAKVAEDRHEEKVTNELRREKLIAMKKEIKDAEENPQDEVLPDDDSYSPSRNVMNKFCFTCHTFTCGQHANVDVEPVMPIMDVNQLKREELLKSGKAKPCGDDCYLKAELKPKVITEEVVDVDAVVVDNEEWSAEEILLLREAAPIYGVDPCNIAIAIGTRSCLDVHLRLRDPIEMDLLKSSMHKTGKVHRAEAMKRKQNMKNAENPKQKVPGATKSVACGGESCTSVDQDFVPCYHNGPCTAENCSCVKRNLYCESTCGCNFGRFQDVNGEGLVEWTEPTEEMVSGGKARICNNRHFGCACEAGHCNTPQCPCWDHNRACNPDFCDCDVILLPNRIELRKRQCRNVPASLAAHKRTFIGRSTVHGFGLFAGEEFEKGDMVGVYSGQLIDTRLADMIGRLYDATDRTYIFNVTESLVIDGGLLGSKAKFVNHTKAGEKENCVSKLVRVKGDAYVALFAKRTVKPGEEFLFDYRFTGEVPRWAQEESS